jgi:Zn finger protein HypA/HybF involved in hydrogenase expression
VVSDEKFSPAERLLVGALTVLMGAVGFAGGRLAFSPSRSVTQPIQFNHQIHVKKAGLECAMCHQYFAEHAHSGLPDMAVCQTCHAEPITKSPEEKKLIALFASPAPPAFQKLFRLPDHAFYSHRRHVTVAKLACETCHGGIADTTAPPPRPLVTVRMSTCIDCHTKQNVQTDCTACHR